MRLFGRKHTSPEIEQIGCIAIPDQIIEPHKFTQNTRLYFEKLIKKIEVAQKSKSLPSNYISIIQSIYRGRLVCRQADCFHVTASESLVDRAINFLDALTKELESRSFKIKSVRDEKAGDFIVAIKGNENISFQISEGYKYQLVEKDSKQKSEWERVLYSGKKPVATGKLTFSVYTRETKIGRNWTDGKSLIEVKLPDIIYEFISLGPRQKQLRKDLAIREEQRKGEAMLFRERESRRYFEKLIYDVAMQEAQTFKAHKELETYLNHLEIQYIEQYGTLSEQALSWFSIARKIAKAQSPLNSRLIQLNAL
jgi:hypothetical protein